MRRRREDPRYPSDMTHYTRRALILVFVAFVVIILATVVLVMR